MTENKPKNTESNPGADAQSSSDEALDAEEERLRKIKQLNRVVCICKGIPLGKVLPHLEGAETVADVNQKAGTGNGGCQGQRCGPRIKVLLKKYQDQCK